MITAIQLIDKSNYIDFKSVPFKFLDIDIKNGRLYWPLQDIYLNSNPPFFLCLNTSFVCMNNQPRQCNASCNRAFIVDWSFKWQNDLKTHQA